MKATILIAMLLSTSICATAADYTTPGDGSEYDFEKLSTISGSGVEKSEGIYVINGTCTIATGDRFKIDSGATIEFDTNGELVIQGTADLQSESPTILRRHGTATGCIGISLQSSAVTEVSNLLFDYVGLRGQGTAGMNVSHCTFTNHSGTVSSALFTGGDGATFVIRDCTFDHCQKAAIGGAANYLCPVSI